MRRRIDWRADDGQVAGIEAIPLGILLFVVGSIMVANAWAVIDAKMAVTSAAREAARTYVESPEAFFDGMSAHDHALRAASEAIDSYQRDPSRLTLIGGEDNRLVRCEPVTFTARYPVPAISLPFIGGFGSGFTVSASHTEVVDPFRDRSDIPNSSSASTTCQ